METRFKIIIATFVAMFSIIAVFFYFYLPVETQAIKMYVTVSNYTGFNVDTDAIYFGTLPGVGTASRKFNLTNNIKEDLFVHISSDGNISEFLSISKNNFLMERSSVEEIVVAVTIPNGNEIGEYSGTLYVKFTRTIS
ncbi:MAG: hypothetical protein ABIF08_02760 [Nanoarchaeota archaeon]